MFLQVLVTAPLPKGNSAQPERGGSQSFEASGLSKVVLQLECGRFSLPSGRPSLDSDAVLQKAARTRLLNGGLCGAHFRQELQTLQAASFTLSLGTYGPSDNPGSGQS